MIFLITCDIVNIIMCYELNYDCCFKVSSSEVGTTMNVVLHVAYG